MDLVTRILEIVHSKRYHGMDAHHIAKQLEMEDSTSFTLICQALSQLEQEYTLFCDEAGRYFTKEQLGYVIGELRINPKGFGFVENEQESVYIHKDHMGLALDKDQVIARMWENQDGSKEGEIVRILHHSITNVVGTIRIKDGKKYFLADAFVNHRRFHITDIHRSDLVHNLKVLVQIDRYEEILLGHVVKVVGYKYDPGVDMLSMLYEHDIDPQFPQDVMQECAKVKDTISAKDKQGRTSLLAEQIITIDGEESRDLDDAISVVCLDEGWRLGVHIADVSYYVTEKSALDQEAYRRGTSVYVADRVVAMLPQALSNGICSLLPRVERLTLSCVMDINAQGEITHYDLFPSYIKSCERMTYTAVNAILAGEPQACGAYAHIQGMCTQMLALSKCLRKRRRELGAIDFDTREAKILLDQKGRVKDIKVRERGEAERIIEDFMIAANECVAAHMKWLEIPSMYRIHEHPEPKKLREFARIASMLGYPLRADVNHIYPKQLQSLLTQAKADEVYPVLSAFMLRSMQKARYDAQCLGHFGLGLQEYLHFTSPIRRYPDLLVHRMLRKYCFEQTSDATQLSQDEQWMEQAAVQCSARERNAIEAERDGDDMKKAEYMERFIDQEFVGVISGVTKFGLFVELPNTVEGLVHISTMRDDYYHFDENGYCLIAEHTGRKYRMGQSVTVRCVDANRYKKQVDFVLVNIKGTSNKGDGTIRKNNDSSKQKGREKGKSYRNGKGRNGKRGNPQ